MLKEMTLTHPRTAVQRGDGDANEAPTTGAWIYAMRSIRSRRTYVGATDRLGHGSRSESSPGDRHQEHLQKGWWQSRGYRTGKQNSLPLYRMTRRWETGLSELVMTPLVALRSATRGTPYHQRRRGTKGQDHETTTRHKVLALEAAMQRRWKPAYTALWGRPKRTGRTRDIAGGRGNEEDEHMPVQELFLVYRMSGERWTPGNDWGAQFRGNTLMLNTEAIWSDATCHQLIRRMCTMGNRQRQRTESSGTGEKTT